MEQVYHLGQGGLQELIEKLKLYTVSTEAIRKVLVDYATTLDVETAILELQELMSGKLLPEGGTTGQVLSKTEDGVEWKDASESISLETLSKFFNKVEYDEEDKEVVFYNDEQEVATLDVTPFIVDNFVKEVEVIGENLVITFNTEDKPALRVPLEKIFDPNKYYTKEEIDTKINWFEA